MMISGKLTSEFLHIIATHLSSRQSCRSKVYRVAIGCYDDVLCKNAERYSDYRYRICFYPNVYVYPSRYDRSEKDKQSILSHILMNHLSSKVPCKVDASGNIIISPGHLVEGIYEYQFSSSNKRRHWVRIK